MADEQRLNESPKRGGAAGAIWAAILILLVFGAGVLVGKPTPWRRPSAKEKSARAAPAPRENAALAACRQEVETRSEARAAASAAAALADEVQGAAPEVVAQIKALRDDLEDCKARDILFRMEVCDVGGRHAGLMYSFMFSAESCEDKTGFGQFIIASSTKCPEFDNYSEDWEPPGNLTEEQRIIVKGTAAQHSRHNKKQTEILVRYLMRKCLEHHGLPEE